MKHIELYGNHAQYENDSHAIPNVSYCIEQNEVHYNPTADPDPYRGHEYVEIGGLKWATVNIGAESPTDYGLYFQWGDTEGYVRSQLGSGEGKKYFGWNDYKFTEDGGQTFTKYNATDKLKKLQLQDDPANANWGGAWRVPTDSDIQKLIESTNITFVNGYNNTAIPGILCTDKEDSSKSIFIPQAGYFDQGRAVVNTGSYRYGTYFTSNVVENYSNTFYEEKPPFQFSGGYSWTQPISGQVSLDIYPLERYEGFPVRAVAY